MKSNALYCFLTGTLLLAACTTPPATYRYSSPAPTDPTISFESDFDLHTHFSVNNKAPEQNKCADFDTAGYLLKRDSVFIYDKANPKLDIRVSADMPIAVSAYHFFNGGPITTQCGPLTVNFVPEKMKQYKVRMNLQNELCFLSIKTIDDNGGVVPMPAKALPKCKK